MGKKGPSKQPNAAGAQGAPGRSSPALLVLALLCGLLYGRTVAFDFTRTDDTVQLVDHARFVGSLAHLPAGYHVTNVLLHLGAACLFFLFVRRLGFALDLSLAAAGVLVAHPVLTSTVAWVPGRDDSLLTMWSLREGVRGRP